MCFLVCFLWGTVQIDAAAGYDDDDDDDRGVNPGGVGGSRPQILGRGSWWEVAGGRGGRELLLYVIMYRKYVRKW